MRKLRRLLFGLLFLGVIALAALFTVNTISFSSKQIKVEAIEPVKINYDAIDRLAEAVKIRTVSHEGEIDTAAFRQLDTFLHRSFPLIDSILAHETINHFSHIYKWQGQNSRLTPVLLLAHLDVVPVENSSQGRWTEPAFGGLVKNNLLYGRGTLDDKSSALGILEAVEMLLANEYTPQRTVYIAFGHDEEVSGDHGAKAIAERFQQQSLEFEFVLDEGSFVVENAMPGLSKPLALIGIAEKGYATVELTVSLEEGGHSSMPSPNSAINLLSEALVRLKNNPSPARFDGPVRAMFEQVGSEMGLFQKVIFANLKWTEPLVKWQMSKDPATNAMLRTTLAPTLISAGFKDNVMPTLASAKVNCRILPGETAETVMDYIRSTIADERVRVSLPKNHVQDPPPTMSGMNTFGYTVVQSTIRQLFPEAVVAPSLVIGATDSRRYASVSKNIYRFLPIQLKRSDLDRLHGIDERISVEQYRNVVRFYRQLILNACK